MKWHLTAIGALALISACSLDRTNTTWTDGKTALLVAVRAAIFIVEQ